MSGWRAWSARQRPETALIRPRSADFERLVNTLHRRYRSQVTSAIALNAGDAGLGRNVTSCVAFLRPVVIVQHRPAAADRSID